MMENGSLFDVLYKRANRAKARIWRNVDRSIDVAVGCALGMNYLHSQVRIKLPGRD